VSGGVHYGLTRALFSAAAAHDEDGEPARDPVAATAEIAAEAQQRMREAAQRWRAPRPG
jgi:hypothetical protein